MQDAKGGKGEIETWNGSSGMVQGYPQSTLLAVAASRAKDKGGPTLSSVPTLRYLLYMPFRDTIRSACGSNGSHVSRVRLYPSHNVRENLPFPSMRPFTSPPPPPPFSLGPPLSTTMHLDRIPKQRIIEASARPSYSMSHKIFARYPRTIIKPRRSAKLIPRLTSSDYIDEPSTAAPWRPDAEEPPLVTVVAKKVCVVFRDRDTLRQRETASSSRKKAFSLTERARARG